MKVNLFINFVIILLIIFFIYSLGLPVGEGGETGMRPIWPTVDSADQNAAHLASCAPPLDSPLPPISLFDLFEALQVCYEIFIFIVLCNFFPFLNVSYLNFSQVGKILFCHFQNSLFGYPTVVSLLEISGYNAS